MKSALFTTVLVTFLVNIACAKPPSPGPSISDLTGVWVEERSVKALQETLRPQHCYQLMINASEDGRTFVLHYGNVTEGVGYQLLGLDPNEKAGEYAFLVGWMLTSDEPDPRPQPDKPLRVRVLLGFNDKGQVAHITLPDECFGFSAPRDPFVRIPVHWTQYIRRVVFAGKWKSDKGDIFSFDESGEGLGPDGGSFTYKLLMAEGIRLRICRCPAIACDDYGFRRIRNELRFFRRAPFSEGGGYEHTPFLVLKKEEE